MTLAFVLAAAWRPEPRANSSMLPWLTLAAFYAALVLFAGEVLGG